MDLRPPQKISIAKVPGKGRGVIAARQILRNETIEVCPFLLLPEEDVRYANEQSAFLRYYLLQLIKLDRHVLLLGYGVLYNHSRKPNAEIVYAAGEEWISFRALRTIAPGEEITIDYYFDENGPDFLSLG